MKRFHTIVVILQAILFLVTYILYLRLSSENQGELRESLKHDTHPKTVDEAIRRIQTRPSEKVLKEAVAAPSSTSITALNTTQVEDLALPIEYYTTSATKNDACEPYYGVQYLRELRDTRRQYCKKESSRGQLACFHSINKRTEGQTDSFCIAGSAYFRSKGEELRSSIEIDCEYRDYEENIKASHIPQRISEFTGDSPRGVFSKFVHLDSGVQSSKFTPEPDVSCPEAPKSQNYTIIVERDLPKNMWHTLMEIFSLTMSLDVLSTTPTESGTETYWKPSEKPNTQIVVVDSMDKGSFWDIWSIVTGNAPIHVPKLEGNVPLTPCFNNVMFPLHGHSNPMWRGDWEALVCTHSALLKTFVNRVLTHFRVPAGTHRTNRPLKVTWIDRHGDDTTRKLLGQDGLLDAARAAYPNVEIEAIDLAAIPFVDQLRVIQETDVLAGIHGAGLTHTFFLPPESAVVEFTVDGMDMAGYRGVDHRGFRNLAKLQGHHYFRDVSKTTIEGDWHFKDVSVEEETFVGILGAAIASMHQSGPRDQNVHGNDHSRKDSLKGTRRYLGRARTPNGDSIGHSEGIVRRV
ncbi:hypothetical protein MMC09_001657 [Bachmanniomyces sp. S44760]|nr:hypothetical protein [Bachmanniomyces sp. S44760]